MKTLKIILTGVTRARLARGWACLTLTASAAVFFAPSIQAQPAITAEPADQSVSFNATAQFSVRARASAGALKLAWWFAEAPLDPGLNPSAVRSTLLLSNVTEAMAGSYQVVVSDDNGSITSRVAQLTVDPTFTKVTQGAPVTDREGSTTATWVDYDQDGYLDLFVGNASGDGSDVLNSLYHNNKDGTFSKVGTNAVARAAGSAWGVGWGDYDNDGRPDLFVAQTGSRNDHLFRNLGGGAFASVASPPVTTDRLDSIMPLWGDYDLDGYIDLFLSAGYWSGPQNDRLYRNEANGQFRLTPASEVGSLVEDNARSTALGWMDYDQDGDLDLFTSHTVLFTVGTQVTNYVFVNHLQGPMERKALPALDVVGLAWGAAWGDFDNDGYPDLFLPAGLGTNGLFRNLEGNGFVDVAETAGLKLAMASNDSAWGDYDNDGWLDLFVGNFQDPGFPNFPGGHALFRNNHDGTFFRVTTGSPANEGGRACGTTWGDYDNDGFLDLYVACGDGFAEPNLLYRNNGNSNHWLKVSLRGTASNRMGIGAKVRVLTTIGGEPLWQTRTISGQHSWISEDGLLAHFGLGDATVAEVVRVEWPSGTVQELKDQSVDRLLTVTEVARIQPARPSASVAGSVTLSTAGTDPYQWRFNGVELPGETKRILALTNLTAAQGGRYSVLVTAADGVITTNFAYLRIDPTFAKVTTGAVANDIEPSQSGTWCDYDADGWPDLFVANYTSGFNTPNSLYHNQRDGSFLRVANRITEGPGHATAGVWADYDNDGDPDLFVARLGGTNQMFCNQGPAGFVRMPTAPTKGPGLEGAWADIDGDGWLDLLVTTTSQTLLYHSLGNGEFRFLTAAQAGTVVQTGDASVSPAFCDFDHDGDPDLYVTADNARSHLYRNLGAGKFGSVVLGAVPPATARVTAVWADYDNDGFFDLFTTSRGNMHTLHRNLNGQEFVDVTVTAGLSLSMPQMVFGAAWGDYDNDADLDLFVPGYSSSSVLYRNDGNGTFTSVDVGSPIVDGATDESASWVDYDGDGLLDLFVACGEGTPAKNLLYRNQLGTLGNANHWLKVRLQGTVSNRDGIGARVRVRATVAGRPVWQVRQISSNGAWAGGTELVAHWGLGNAATAGEVRIEWPSGIVQELRNVPANQILTVTEPPALEALGEGRIRLLCWARQSHEVEVSDDLQTWHSLGVVATDQHRPVILDPGAAGKPHRFYRAKGL